MVLHAHCRWEGRGGGVKGGGAGGGEEREGRGVLRDETKCFSDSCHSLTRDEVSFP